MKKLSILVVLLMLTVGCNPLSPVKESLQKTYTLTAVPNIQPQTANSQKTLLVSMPRATAAYITSKMAYTEKPYQSSYFTENRWIDSPARLLFPLVIESLQNTRYYHAVVASPFVGQADWRLDITLLELQQNFMTHPSEMVVSLRARLVNTTSQKVIATQVLTAKEPASEATPYGGVVAANKAVEKILVELAQLCVEHT